MGNSGSVHNLHNDGVNSEINAYYSQQQYLKRTAGEAKRHNFSTLLQHHNDIVLSGAERPIAAFKVLPKPTESLQLRATTNGAILHAGGTISCRAKDYLDDKSGSSSLDREKDPTFHPMRRSHTLILDSYNESGSYRKSAPALTFRRSQTLLHIGYNRTNTQENKSSPKFDERKNRSTPHTTANGTGSTLKINKYNKKRKAPPAPIKNPTTDEGSNISCGNILTSEAKTTCLAKPRIYTTNSYKSGNTLQKQPHHQHLQETLSISPFAPFQRGSRQRNSANSQVHVQKKECSSSKVPYRREKSFDAVLLRQRNSYNEYYERSPVQMRKPLGDQERDRQQNLKIVKHTTDSGRGSRKPPGKNTPNKISSKAEDFNGTETLTTQPKITQRVEHKLREKPHQEKLCLKPRELDAKNMKQFKDNIENHAGTEKKAKVQQQSRIPQLKRTFYFGMESTNPKTLIPDESRKSNNPVDKSLHGLRKDEKTKKDKGGMEDEAEAMNMHALNIAHMEEIEDNGILVHVRPTLPRRQPETPSFSPTAAWRNLLEEQQRLQHERAKVKQAISDIKLVETPIYLNSVRTKENLTTPLTWTPQQDLEDEDEEEEENDEKLNQNNLELLSSKLESRKQEMPATENSLHVFSLSLPRDVHLPGQLKSSLDCTSGPGLKSNCWLVPGFNSLQKFKSTLSGGAGARLNNKCTCPKDINKRVSANSSQPPPQFLQTIFGETFTTDPHNHVPECELFKAFQFIPSSHNDNWVLHKSKINENSVPTTTNNYTTPSPHLPANTHSLVYMQPKSLTHVCGGKHFMYLPGQESYNVLSKESQQKTSTVTYKRQRQRQETARESLQDLTPVQDIQKSNVRMPEKNTHRFSFQSTVRVLEKRRLAEKLSKDAEIQEAQRLHELEAMKRVEEDFQRKRAQEKANIRNQLRLHLNSNLDNENFRSLPLHINENYEHLQQQSDTNNNIFCRAEPDGAVSPPRMFNDRPDTSEHYTFPLISPKTIEMRRSDSDCEESELETQLADFQRTALLIEPYLQSII